MWRSDIPSTTVTPSGPQRSLPRMGASSLRAQEPQLMRSPGEPLQLNQRSFGCMIELAVIGHRPRARSSSDASRGSVEITVLPRTSRRQLSPVTNFLCAASALLLCGPLCGFARVQDWTLSYQAPVPQTRYWTCCAPSASANRGLTADIRVSRPDLLVPLCAQIAGAAFADDHQKRTFAQFESPSTWSTEPAL